MRVTCLRTAAFRNLDDTEINTAGKDIFLIGENGQGKTNLLEALYFCSYGSSFRGVRDRDMVRNGEKNCSATVSLEGSVYSTVCVAYKDEKKIISLDGKRLEDRKDLLSVAPSIVFCHEDIDFVSGTPERRRWFFDQTRSLWDLLYLDDLRNYRHVLKSRNSLLRAGTASGETGAMLDAVDPQLGWYGLELIKRREETADDFSRVFEPLYREVSGISGIGVRYLPSWKEDQLQGIIGLLSERRESDLRMGITLSGPHRDRYLFTREGEEFSGKASTGQRRLLALLLRIAQIKVFTEKTGKRPVLLLDDVLLELDGEKRRKFLSVMPEYDQAFYTFLPGEPYTRYRKSDTLVYYMDAGRVKGEV